MADISILQFPLSLILSAAFVLGAFLTVRYLGHTKFNKLLSEPSSAAALAAVATVLISVEGTFTLDIQHNVFFIALCILLMLSLSIAVAGDIYKKASAGSLLSHAGLLIIMFGVLFGSADFQKGLIPLTKGSTEYVARADDGHNVVLPFKLSLESFEIDYYEDGISPRQYSSNIIVDGIRKTTAVNNPCCYKGWFIYQNSFNKENMDSTVLEVVRDPWLPIVFFGMFILAVGAILSVRNVWKSKYVIIAALALTAIFTLVSLARITLSTLMPALRSLWFVPHLAAYMLAYSFLAISLILGTISLVSDKKGQIWLLSRRLLQTSSSLLILGMLCGAVWAKFAWGDYWTWDPKECWAGATWLLTLAATHTPCTTPPRRKLSVIIVLISFIFMQVTWYGVNYLPSARDSVHTYNVK